MKQLKKFYYIDKNGDKKKYVGAVINNHNGTFSGYLGSEKRTDKTVELKYHPAIEYVEGYSSYYTYINSEGEEQKYYGLMKTNEDGTKYFTYFITNQIELIYKAPETKINEYYTYYDSVGNSHIYSGKTTFENGSYYGLIEI